MPIVKQTRKGEVSFDTDEHVKPGTTLESLAKMKPAFKKDGTVTAGNASGINDGAAFLVLGDATRAAADGHKAIARLVSYAVAGVPNDVMGEGPIPATKLALKKGGPGLDQDDVIRSNEARLAGECGVARGSNLDMKKTNPNGGAIGLGHPIGCSGAFITVKALYELQRTGGRYALVTMCIGGGQGIAAVFGTIRAIAARHRPAAATIPAPHPASSCAASAGRPPVGVPAPGSSCRRHRMREAPACGVGPGATRSSSMC